MSIIQDYLKTFHKPNKKYPSFKTGDTVKVYQKIVEGQKERVQVFEGLVISKKGDNYNTATITVRKISNGVGVERIFPLNSPSIVEIDVVKRAKVRRSKLYYMRALSGKKARLKETRTNDKTEFMKDEAVEETQGTTTPEAETATDESTKTAEVIEETAAEVATEETKEEDTVREEAEKEEKVEDKPEVEDENQAEPEKEEKEPVSEADADNSSDKSADKKEA